MKKTLLAVSSLITLAVLISSSAIAQDKIYTADEAYKAMLTLEGKWTGEALLVPVGSSKADGSKSSTSVTYRNIAAGSSIMATYLEGSPAEMVSLYHQDGKDTLIHTHYCAAGNQPSMTFAASMEKGGIDFRFTEGTNMDVTKDGHAHHSFLKIIDEDHFESRSERWRDGKLASVRYTTMTRQK